MAKIQIRNGPKTSRNGPSRGFRRFEIDITRFRKTFTTIVPVNAPTRKRLPVLAGLAVVLVLLAAVGLSLKRSSQSAAPTATDTETAPTETSVATPAPAKPGGKLSAREIARRLREILAVVTNPVECATQIKLVLQEADFSDPETGPTVWQICVEAADGERIPHNSGVLRMIGSFWAKADPDGALEFFRGIVSKDGEINQYLFSALTGVLLERWEINHDDAFAAARSIPDKTGRLLVPLYGQWLTEDRATAWAAAKREVLGEIGDTPFLIRVALTLETGSPEIAIRLVQELRPSSKLDSDSDFQMSCNNAIQRIAQIWAERDWWAAASFYDNAGNNDRSLILSALIPGLYDGQPREKLQWLSRPGHEELLRICGGPVFHSLARQDFQAAMQEWQSAGLESRQNWLPELVKAFAATSPADAVRWSLDLGDSTEIPAANRNGATALAFAQWLSADSAAATAFLENRYATSPPPPEIARAWATADMDYALGYVRQMGSGAERDRFVADLLASNEWGASRTHSIDMAMIIEDPSIRQSAIGRTARTWGSSAPEAALDWAASLNDSGLRDTAVRGVFESWASHSSTDAQRHLGEFSGATRDQALIGFVHGTMSGSPADAAPWAVAISDPTNRRGALESVFQRWYSSDRAGADRWLANSGLTDSERRSLLRYRRD